MTKVIPFRDEPASGDEPEAVMLPRSEHMNFIEWSELIGWRRVSGRLQIVLEELIAAKGDRAEEELIRLQHELVQLSAAPQLAEKIDSL